MATVDVLRSRTVGLIAQVYPITGRDDAGNMKPNATQDNAVAQGWLVAAGQLIDSLCPNGQSAYRQWIHETKERLKSQHRPNLTEALLQGREVLSRLLADLNDGLLFDLTNRVTAETFDDFLDHADVYLTAGRKNPAGVIAGVVFEDTIRRIARGEEKGRKLEDVINDLTKVGTISGLTAKRAKVAAHVRTKATHAQWEEFDEAGVKDTIQLTRELIQLHLDKSSLSL
jgi:hypothetical protein